MDRYFQSRHPISHQDHIFKVPLIFMAPKLRPHFSSDRVRWPCIALPSKINKPLLGAWGSNHVTSSTINFLFRDRQTSVVFPVRKRAKKMPLFPIIAQHCRRERTMRGSIFLNTGRIKLSARRIYPWIPSYIRRDLLIRQFFGLWNLRLANYLSIPRYFRASHKSRRQFIIPSSSALIPSQFLAVRPQNMIYRPKTIGPWHIHY